MSAVVAMGELDAIVVGTGAGGATVGRELARGGWSVLFIEEGPDRRDTPGEATTRDSMLGRLRDFGAQLASGSSRIPLIQARVVGGSTAINSAIFWQLPEYVHADWLGNDPGLCDAIPYREIADATAEIERDLSVHAVERNVLGRNNELLEKGAKALGMQGNVIRRAERGCEGSARCFHGCPNRRRQGMDVSYVPDALAHGAELMANTKVLRVRIEGGRATGVEVRYKDGTKGFVRARRAVVLAAGAVHSPWLLLKSGLRGATGQRFTAHPGFTIAGMFPEPVRLHQGATQGYEVTEVRKQGLKIEGLGLAYSVAVSRLPGAGAAFKRLADRLENLATWACLVRPEKHGWIKRSITGGVRARLELGAGDYARLLEGVKHLTRLYFAAGATEVFPGIAGAPASITSPAPIEAMTSLAPGALSMVATHLFGGAVIGTDPAHAVVDHRFRVHGVESLFVADASVIPTSLGVNPQGTIMALSRIAADRILGTARVARAAA